MQKTQVVARLNEDRCISGIEGLDEILCGGFPKSCFYLIQGDPGSGKTTLALQFLIEGLKLGESAFYVTLSETKNELTKVAHSHGWSLDQIPLIELAAIESLLNPDEQNTVFHPSEVELNKVTELLLREMNRIKPARVVFDSLSEFRLMAESPLRYRRHLLRLKQEFAKIHSTVLLLDDKMDTPGIGVDPHVLSLTHGVVEMEQHSPDYGSSRRRLRIRKLRGIKFREGYHDYEIVKGGIRIFPRLIASEHHATVRRESVSSGIPELDQLFGGGLDRGTTSLFIGSAGTGKSTLALQYVHELAKHGEHSVLFAFDETTGIMRQRAAQLGLDLEKSIESGTVKLEQIDPAELSPGEFAVRLRKHVESGCKLVVLDTLNGYLNSMPGEKYLLNQLHEICTYLNQQGVITILVLAQHGLVAAAESPIDLSYLADMVVNLRFFEALGEVKLSVSVIKKRSGQHERTIREFKLQPDRGIRIGPVLKEFQGVLSGIPVFQGSGAQIMKRMDEQT